MASDKHIAAWLKQNTESLVGKTVAVTGSTGGLGCELCRYLVSLGASLVLVDRNPQRSKKLRDELRRDYAGANIECVTADLEDMSSVRKATEELSTRPIDVFIHNAGAYSIPRRVCTTGYDNVFQINFISPYYMIRRLMPTLARRNGRVVVVGSIAHWYSESDEHSVDFADRPQASLVYGNAKRYLMFALYALFRDETEVALSVTHPGISLTGITAHYPKLIFAVIKHPMKVLFMRPKKACLSILRGVFESCGENEWIGPRVFNVWGWPKKRRLSTVSADEAARIDKAARDIYESLL